MVHWNVSQCQLVHTKELRFHSLHRACTIKSMFCVYNSWQSTQGVTRHGTPVKDTQNLSHTLFYGTFLSKQLPTTMASKDLLAELVLHMRWDSEKYENVSTACLHSGKNSCPFGPCLLDTYLHSSWCSGRSVPLCRCHWGCRSYLKQRTT